MLFNSWLFVFFFLTVLTIYWTLPHRRQNLLLVFASYAFYAVWDWRFLFLLWISTLLDYFIARALDRSEDSVYRKRLLFISVVVNLGILGFFKYFNFFADSAVGLMNAFGFEPSFTFLHIILPVGISFYTFQTMAYTIDVYHRRQPAVSDFIPYAVYVCYFPQLVAGPIERAKNLIPQIQAPRSVSRESFSSGIQLILWGYLKKVVIADGLAPIVDTVYGTPGDFTTFALILGAWGFAVQVYCDFSGYSDIARGVSRLLGIELMVNFRQPFFARNITDHWRRWHISLSTWLRDYLYFSIGGNRVGTINQYRNLMITMLLGGLWHGAGWTYVIWGGLNGLFLSVHKLLTRGRKIDAVQAPRGGIGLLTHFAWAFVTFNFVAFSMIPFRSADLPTALAYVKTLFSFEPTNLEALTSLGLIYTLGIYMGVMLFLDLRCWYRDEELPFSSKDPMWIRGMAYGLALVMLGYMRGVTSESFFYFQF